MLLLKLLVVVVVFLLMGSIDDEVLFLSQLLMWSWPIPGSVSDDAGALIDDAMKLLYQVRGRRRIEGYCLFA